jgi:predicted HTH domain antitoxin
MKNVTIPIDIPSDLMVALNESEEEMKLHFQTAIAIVLFQEGKITIGKAVQLSGLTRHEFEKVLANNKIPISNLDIEQIKSDVQSLSTL